MTELRAWWKLFVVVVKQKLGVPEHEITLDITTTEADALLQAAVRYGWRALTCRLLEVRDDA